MQTLKTSKWTLFLYHLFINFIWNIAKQLFTNLSVENWSPLGWLLFCLNRKNSRPQILKSKHQKQKLKQSNVNKTSLTEVSSLQSLWSSKVRAFPSVTRRAQKITWRGRSAANSPTLNGRRCVFRWVCNNEGRKLQKYNPLTLQSASVLVPKIDFHDYISLP